MSMGAVLALVCISGKHIQKERIAIDRIFPDVHSLGYCSADNDSHPNYFS